MCTFMALLVCMLQHMCACQVTQHGLACSCTADITPSQNINGINGKQLPAEISSAIFQSVQHH